MEHKFCSGTGNGLVLLFLISASLLKIRLRNVFWEGNEIRPFWKRKSFSFIFNSSIRDVGNSGSYLNCNCYISCSLAIQRADEHISLSHLKWIYYVSWLRKVPETARLMFCKWSHSRVIFSLSSSFGILFQCVWDLLLNHWCSFWIPFEYPANCVEGKREYYGLPTALDFSRFCFHRCHCLCPDSQSPVPRGLAEPSCPFIAAVRLLLGAAGGCGSPRSIPCQRERVHGCSAEGSRDIKFSLKYPSAAGGGDVTHQQGCCLCLVI